MSWVVTIPGTPISGNHANKIGKGYRKLRDGSVGSYPKIVKTEEAEAYMAGAAMIVRAAKPPGWKWSGGFVVSEWRLWLGPGKPLDFTNVCKTVEDVIFPVLGVDDVWSMPRCMSIERGCPPNEVRVEVTIDADR